MKTKTCCSDEEYLEQDPLLRDCIPRDIRRDPKKLAQWMKQNGHERWKRFFDKNRKVHCQ